MRTLAFGLSTGLLALTLGLGGCATMQRTRDRIVKAPAVCQDVTIPIYFEPGVASLTPEGRRVISAEAARVRDCRVEEVRVMGLADAAGSPGANLDLSKRRADSVTAALLAARLPAAQFDVVAAGQSGATTADGSAQPLRRRADITLKLSAPAR